MRLLIVTQALDTQDPALGFFVTWLAEFSKHFERIELVCLKEGQHPVLPNVRVHSLGKEHGISRIKYLMRFYRFAWLLRHEYDAVFVHMNQEYVLLGGWLWKLLGKKVYLWRNHYQGSWRTDLAAFFADKVFCTSRFSYTAHYRQTVFMPVGVDTRAFVPLPDVARVPRSVLFIARFSSSKRPDLLVEALGLLHARGFECSASFYGAPEPREQDYPGEVEARARELGIDAQFFGGIPHAQTPRVFSEHALFVDLGAAGMYNKTLFEAAACGALVLAVSPDLHKALGSRFHVEADDAAKVAEKIEATLALPAAEQVDMRIQLQRFAGENSLIELGRAIEREVTM